MSSEPVTAASIEVPVTQRQLHEQAARAWNTSRTGVERAAYIMRIAGDERMPQDLRDRAADWAAKIDAGTATVWCAYDDLRWRWRRAGLSFARYCAVCSTRFRRQREDALYCSNACRQKAYRDRGGA